MSSYALHPAALADLDEIWGYIAEDNLDAADRVIADIHAILRSLAAAPHIGHRRPDARCVETRLAVVDLALGYERHDDTGV